MDRVAVREREYLQTDVYIGASTRITPHEVWEGIAEDEFVPSFQPVVALRGMQLAGFEALLRWKHPKRGRLSAGMFLPVLKDSFLFEDLTSLVLEKAVRQCSRWRKAGLDVPVSINLPPAKLLDSGLPERLEKLVLGYGLDPCHLVVEVPEPALAMGNAAALEILVQLRMRDFGVAIDDYGVGQCPRDQLECIPASELKLDRTLLAGATRDAALRARLRAAVELARELNFRSVAEGVENQEEWDLINELGCDLAQGYFIARPMSGEALAAWHELWLTQPFL